MPVERTKVLWHCFPFLAGHAHRHFYIVHLTWTFLSSKCLSHECWGTSCKMHFDEHPEIKHSSDSTPKSYQLAYNRSFLIFGWLYTKVPQTNENVHSLCPLQLAVTCAGWIWSKYLAGRFLSSALILHINSNPLSKLFAFCKFSS